ncbi:oxygen-insensitive NAD(P)H nitroreductase [Massilia sp. YIM B02763]|uniref:oxygen-insensitive NAD(P)H nitroreductase n=1 Tax=Massilia sp. YIM B02763 TaxID=3050130 RepID=UPI0025B70D91|nr:oxygen-insensitive NAD(P)H nitroreductase [Massilia sp. YIM B02763]MDN4056183.1 oxygen-insensitive NAD(P)H nitroreductase [Massilia sp. YIM B02763]
MDIVSAAKTRYTTKAYDPTRKVPEDTMRQILEVLRLSPSSVNSQPWHFIVASTPEGKERVAKGAQGGYAFNASKITQASHVIVFCSRVEADAGFQDLLLSQEQRDGRYADDAAKAGQAKGRAFFIDLHRFQGKDQTHWLEKQVYLALGTTMLAAATLGVDTTPMEGIDTKAIDEEFGLRAKGLTSLVVLSLGYHAEDDFNAKLPKSRLKEEQVFTFV